MQSSPLSKSDACLSPSNWSQYLVSHALCKGNINNPFLELHLYSKIGVVTTVESCNRLQVRLVKTALQSRASVKDLQPCRSHHLRWALGVKTKQAQMSQTQRSYQEPLVFLHKWYPSYWKFHGFNSIDSSRCTLLY